MAQFNELFLYQHFKSHLFFIKQRPLLIPSGVEGRGERGGGVVEQSTEQIIHHTV